MTHDAASPSVGNQGRSSDDDWERLRDRFSRIALRRGIDEVADAIPADRVTVYRLITGETKRPSRAVRAGIERVVAEAGDEE